MGLGARLHTLLTGAVSRHQRGGNPCHVPPRLLSQPTVHVKRMLFNDRGAYIPVGGEGQHAVQIPTLQSSAEKIEKRSK